MLLLAACVQVPKEDRLLGSSIRKQAGGSLEGRSLKVVSWNVHKAAHADLPGDLALLAAQNDLLLLQEAVPTNPLVSALERAGHSWQMVDAFGINKLERGVMVAAKVPAIHGRALRTLEPLFPLPKSAIVTHYKLVGRRDRLAVANLHGINFSLGVGRFRNQLEAVVRELKEHRGPIIFGGDFNTWSRRRHNVLGEVTRSLGLTAVNPSPDNRRLAFGRHLDHLFLRGFDVQSAQSPATASSDHSPIHVRLILKPSVGSL